MTQTQAAARLKAGDPAPDATITFAGGEETTLSALFKQRRTILVFLRHFG
jgi:peroxiredoxin